jgi:hypothetical protein
MRVVDKTYSNTFHGVKVKIGKTTITIHTDEETLRIPLPDGLPLYLSLPAGNQFEGATVRVNGSADMLYSLYPSYKSHVVRYKKMPCRDGELPMPRMVEGKDIKMKDGRKFFKPEHLEFTIILEVLSGDWAGAEIPYFLEYVFAADKDKSTILNGGKKANEKVMTLLDLAGFDLAQEDIPWSDNVLPDLDQILSERASDHPFQVSMEKGYIKSCEALPAGLDKQFKGVVLDFAEEDEDENPFEVPADKKPAVDEDDDFEDEEEEAPAPPARTRRTSAWKGGK